jgi:hypothetical protein
MTYLSYLLLAIVVLVGGEDDSFLKFWPNNSSVQSDPEVPRSLFITSWSAQGRKNAIQQASKFESIVLCLYDLRFEEKNFRLEKLTEIEPSFIRDLKAANPSIKVFLRIYVVS